MKQRLPYLPTIAIALLAVLSGCFRLDANLFNADATITEYQFDAYVHPDDWDVIPDPAFTIADSNIHLFTLASQADGESEASQIYAVYLGETSQIASDTVILYCHGNYAHMDAYWQRAKILANLGHKHRFGVLMFDYRGFGLSEGVPTEQGMYADASACIDWLLAMGLTDDRFAMYGFSLGSAPATELTAHPQALTPSWLMLEAPFASSEMMAQEGTGLAVPGSFFTNFKIDNAEEIKFVQQPFFWLHGIDDHFLSYENHGLSVWNNYQGVSGVQLAVPGAGHGNVVGTMGVAAYQEAVLGFLSGQ
jgi:pimeloyl-ACP methyl ester carboxylesterase